MGARTATRSDAPAAPGAADLGVALLLAFPLVAAFAAPAPLEGWAALIAAGLACAVAVAISWHDGFRLSRKGLITIALLGAGAGWLALRSYFTTNPSVSLLGMQGASDGSALRLTAWAVFAASALLPVNARSARMVRVTLALAGAVAAIGALLDRAGVIPHPDYWSAEPSGFLSTSNSLGQLLVLCLGASVSWLFAEKPRWWAAACAALCGSALVASGSRTALAAGVLAALAVAAVALARTPRARAVIAAAVAIAAALVAGAAAWASAAGGRATELLGQLLTDRPAIWRAAWAQAMQSPLVGEGSRMFSAYYTWSVDPNRLFGADTIASFSPHSEPLDILVSGGLVGVALALVGIAALVGTVSPAFATIRRRDPVWPLLAGLAAWSLMACVGILDTPAFLAASALAGTLLGSTQGRDAAVTQLPARVVAGFAAGASVVVALALITPVAVGLQSLAWGTMADVGPEELPRYAVAYSRTHDPSYLTEGLTALISQTQGDYPDQLAGDARMLAGLAEKDTSWHVHAAYLSAAAHALRSTETTAAQYEAIAYFLDRGKAADPTATVWRHLRAREAARLGVER